MTAFVANQAKHRTYGSNELTQRSHYVAFGVCRDPLLCGTVLDAPHFPCRRTTVPACAPLFQ